MSDLKIVNGRIGKDKLEGNYTCYTSRGKSTIDYAIASMSLFPHITNFFIDCMDKCMSDVHCPICLVLSSRNCIESERNFAQNVNDVSSNEYMIKNQISTKWNHDYSEQYTSSFDLEDIIDIQAQINKVIVVPIPVYPQLMYYTMA